MTAPLIPVAWGEVFDKVAILTLKTQRLRNPSARTNAQHELDLLMRVAGPPDRATAELRSALLAVNTRLWRIEDLIRERDSQGDFGAAFVALARLVYRENDERMRIKAELNRVLRSEVVEEKQYAAYGA